MEANTIKTKSLVLKKIIRNEETRLLIPPIIISILLFVIGQILNPGFASLLNIGSILAIAGILAVGSAGQTLVIISGNYNIDLSIGALMSMGAVLASGLMRGLDGNIVYTIIVMIGIGGFFGFISGAGVWWMGVPALVMTLAMESVIDGFTLAVSKGRPFGEPAPMILKIGGEMVFGWLRWHVILTIILIIVFTLVLTKTKYGKKLFLIGNNRVAAKANGMNIGFIIIITFILSGVMGAIAGIFLLAAVGTAQMQMGAPYTMLSVAAVVLGGTQLSGGKGSYIGTAVGAIVLVALTNVLISIGMAQGVRLIITGLVLIVILAAYSRQPKLRQ